VERGVLSVDEASAVYRHYIKGRFWYAKSLVAGRPRINLNVQPDGFVTAADEAAVRPLIKAIELRAAKRAEQARAASKATGQANTAITASRAAYRASGSIWAQGSRNEAAGYI
jgi:sRNA-binding protein